MSRVGRAVRPVGVAGMVAVVALAGGIASWLATFTDPAVGDTPVVWVGR